MNESRFLYESINDIKVLCTMGCGAKVKYELLGSHVRSECSKAKFLCKHGVCLHNASREQIAAHESTCGEATFLCACGQQVKLKQEPEHRKNQCPLSLVKCEYCGKDGIAREGLEAHLDECNGSVPISFVRKLEAQWSAKFADMEEKLAALESGKRRKVQQ